MGGFPTVGQMLIGKNQAYLKTCQCTELKAFIYLDTIMV